VPTPVDRPSASNAESSRVALPSAATSRLPSGLNSTSPTCPGRSSKVRTSARVSMLHSWTVSSLPVNFDGLL
jgi:hypothetical protein